MPANDSPVLNIASEKKMDAILYLLIEMYSQQTGASDNDADNFKDKITKDLNKKYG